MSFNANKEFAHKLMFMLAGVHSLQKAKQSPGGSLTLQGPIFALVFVPWSLDVTFAVKDANGAKHCENLACSSR